MQYFLKGAICACVELGGEQLLDEDSPEVFAVSGGAIGCESHKVISWNDRKGKF